MSKPLPPSRTAPQFVIRFPDEALRERVKAEAELNSRSMNAEIVQALQSYYSDLDRKRWESSPEYFEELERAAMESMPDGPFRSANERFAEIRADKEASRLAEKVVSKLISTEEFIKKIQESLRVVEDRTALTDKLASDPSNPLKSATPAIPGVNAPKGGSKSPKK